MHLLSVAACVCMSVALHLLFQGRVSHLNPELINSASLAAWFALEILCLPPKDSLSYVPSPKAEHLLCLGELSLEFLDRNCIPNILLDCSSLTVLPRFCTST